MLLLGKRMAPQVANDVINNCLNGNLFNFVQDTVSYHRPAVNIAETNQTYEIEVTLPGFKRDEIKVNVDKNTLTIVAEKQVETVSSTEVENETPNVEKKYKVREFAYNAFKRMFELPEVVDVEGIVAKNENGILVISLPKKQEHVKVFRNIEIA